MKKKRGITLLELLLAALISAMVAAALADGFYVVVHYELTAPQEAQNYASKIRFEDRVRDILEAAYLSPTATDQTTYLIGTVGGQNPNGQPNLTAALAAPGSTAATQALAAASSGTTNATSAIANGSADGIVLTVLGRRISPRFLEATGVSLSDDGNGGNNTNPTGGNENFQQQMSTPAGQQVQTDFSTLNSTYGAVGGVTEMAISKTPSGDPGQFADDVYLRTQTPSDADYTQGGTEQLFDPNVAKMQFEFFDGLQWDGGWDTTSSGGRHLPAAIRVHYWLKSDPNTENVFVVWLPLSDLTPAQPLSSVATTSTTTTVPAAGAGTGGRTTPGASERILTPLPGISPLFGSLQIEPDGSGGAPVDQLDASTVFGPDPLAAQPQPDTNQLVEPGQLQPWQLPPGPFAFRPEGDPLAPNGVGDAPVGSSRIAGNGIKEQAPTPDPVKDAKAKTQIAQNGTTNKDERAEVQLIKSGSASVADGSKVGGDH